MFEKMRENWCKKSARFFCPCTYMYTQCEFTHNIFIYIAKMAHLGGCAVGVIFTYTACQHLFRYIRLGYKANKRHPWLSGPTVCTDFDGRQWIDVVQEQAIRCKILQYRHLQNQTSKSYREWIYRYTLDTPSRYNG